MNLHFKLDWKFIQNHIYTEIGRVNIESVWLMLIGIEQDSSVDRTLQIKAEVLCSIHFLDTFLLIQFLFIN